MRPHFARFFRPAFDAANDDGAGKGLTREEVIAIATDQIKRAAGTGDKPDLAALASVLADEKEKTAAARREVATLQAQVPGVDDVVLKGDAAKRYNDLKAREGYDADPLGKALSDLDANATALADAAALKSKAAQDAAFKAAGIDPDKARRYLSGVDARLEGEGDAAKPVFVTKGDDGKETTLDLEAFKTANAEILPVLSGSGETPARRGGHVIAQRSTASSSGKADPVADFIAARNERSAGATPATDKATT